MKQLKPKPAAGAVALKPSAAITAASRDVRGKESETMSENVIHAARALLKGTISENALGADVMYALRGFRAGLVDRRGYIEAVARGYRSAGAAFKFDGNGNLRRA